MRLALRVGKARECLCYKQRAGDFLVAPVFADGLSNGKDMRLGKRLI
jgi:hypothetical protein